MSDFWKGVILGAACGVFGLLALAYGYVFYGWLRERYSKKGKSIFEEEMDFLDSIDFNEYAIDLPLTTPRRKLPYCGNLNQSMEYPYRCVMDWGHDHESNPPEKRRHQYAGIYW
jgi:hypothetical protein